MREGWEKMADRVRAFSGLRVVVVGDLVLDRFWYGAVQRVSREAPVPIVRLNHRRLLPGCAANTVWNLKMLGADPLPVGVVGGDEAGDQLLRLFENLGVDLGGILKGEDWETPTKTRVLAGALHGSKQQLVRVDSGEENVVTEELGTLVGGLLRDALAGADALILSDYGYGLVEASGAREFLGRVPVTALDSRFALTRFSGLTTATPNEEEFEAACGKPVCADEGLFEREAEAMRKRLDLGALLVTRGRRGMSLFEKRKQPVHLPVVGSDQVVDVTGAGDTVISSFVLALSAGASFKEAANIANAAGGTVVQKHGTATTDQKELTETLKAWGEGRL